MKEYYEVMNTIKEFTAEDAMVIVGTVIDDSMGDEPSRDDDRHGLGRRSGDRQTPAQAGECSSRRSSSERTGTDGMGMQITETIDYDRLERRR